MSSSIPLTQAVTSGDEEAVAALLAKGADVNESTSGGQTALILAVIFGHTNLVKLLVSAGADPQLRDNLGLNALEWAQRRGLTEALSILTNGAHTNVAPARPVKIHEPEQTVAEPPVANTDSSDTQQEKSRRWLAGLKQRLDEQAMRRSNRNEPISPPPPPPPPVLPEEEPPTLMTVASTEKPVTVTINTVEAAKPQEVKQELPATARILTPPEKPSTTPGTRKRCPKCNAIYNGELLAYCAHHYVKLVDADAPIISEPARMNPAFFWILVIITLTGSIVIGTLVTTYLYKSNNAEPQAASQQPAFQKGTPEVGGELAGKAVSLPEAQCPLSGPDPVSGEVVVRVMVDKNGLVYWARGSGGDWLMRGAATEAAMKSTFSREKLRGRETEGTITYKF